MHLAITGQELADSLRLRCDKARERVWIASPFIGDPLVPKKNLGQSMAHEKLCDGPPPNGFEQPGLQRP
jgi:hypothetical protein